jgi:hypothetical protein
MSLRVLTFSDIGLRAGSADFGQVNLTTINAFLANFGSQTEVLVGDSGTFYIASSSGRTSINLPSNAVVQCLPGCTIKWTVDSGITAAIRVAEGVRNVWWSGGTFAGEAEVKTVGGVTHRLYPANFVFDIRGDDVRLEDMTVDGYNGIAFRVLGDRVRVINPTVRNPQAAIPAGVFQDDPVPANGAGIRMMAGDGFRCYGGDIRAGGDGAIQFSSDIASQSAITNGLYRGVDCASVTGRLILVDTTMDEVRDVRFIGITGHKPGPNCMLIENRDRPLRPATRPVRRVVLRDAVFSHDEAATMEARENPVIAIANEYVRAVRPTPADDVFAVSDILFDNVAIASRSWLPFVAAAPTELDLDPIRTVVWRGGSIVVRDGADPAAGFCVTRLDGGLFQGLRIAGGAPGATLLCGQARPGTNQARARCANVTFVDVAIRNLRAGARGLLFGRAVNCGFVRGSVSAAAPEGGTPVAAVAVRLEEDADRCFVEGVDLSRVGGTAKVQPTSATRRRQRDLFGWGRTVIPPAGLGPQVAAPMTAGGPDAHTIPGRSGVVGVRASGGSPPVALVTVSGGAPGDVLVVSLDRGVGAPAVNARDGTGNLRLAGGFVIGTPGDLLTLVGTGAGNWAELARSRTA